MTKEQLTNIWAGSELPKSMQDRITGEVYQLIYNDTKRGLRHDETRVRNLLIDLRYMSIISPNEHYKLVSLLEETVAERRHQLEGVTND